MEKEDNKILLAKYQLIKEIGRGGMGVIYLAQDPTLNRPVAIKELIVSNLIDKEERDDLVERFRREALSAASLNHQNIVTIFEVGKDEDIHFIAMEYLEGITLKDYIDQNLSYSFSDIIDIMIQIVNGLAHAHSRGIIHRDIKPENIRIINENTVKIMDFGIAGNKKNDPTKKRLTQNGTILGTIGYMSPEQLYDLKLVDNRSDIFSYGVMFYEFFTGKLPFESDSIGQSIMNIMQIDPIKPSEINSSLPIEICNMIMKCLEKNPEKRYQNFSEISQDLNLQKFLIMNSAILNDLSLENITKPKETFKFSQKGTHENVNSNTLVEKSKKLMNSILKSSNRVSEIADFYDSKLNIKHLRTFNDLDTKFSSPRNIFLSKKGFLFVADTKNKMVQILDKIGNLNFILCHENMNSPCAISQDNNENIYILDSDDCKVRVFDKNYKHLFEFAGQGNSSNNLKSASSIVVSSDNKVYISDHESALIKIFDTKGLFIKNIAKLDEYKSPISLTYYNNRLFVLDNAIPKIQINSKEGRALFNFGKRGLGLGEFTVPRNISTDKFGNIYVAEKLTHRIQIFDQNGNYLAHFGTKGTDNGKFIDPESVVISEDFEIFVLDRGNNRIQVFEITKD